jgi:hypothetical protein
MRITSVVLSAVLAVLAVAGIAMSDQAGAHTGPSGAAAASGAASGAATARAAAYQPTGRYHFVEHGVTDTVVDLRPKGDSRGDLLAFANPVYNGSNTRRVGRDEGSCVRTAPGRSWECEWTLRLPAGHLVVQGPFFDKHDSVLAITGGTGIWARARGQMVLHARNAQGTRYDFRYHVTR